MSLQTLGYIGLRTRTWRTGRPTPAGSSACNWWTRAAAPPRSGWTTRSSGSWCTRTRGDAPGFFGWEVADAAALDAYAANLERHKVSFARGSRALAEERKVRDLIVLQRSGRQPAGNFPRRRDHHRSVQARPRHLRLPHRSARHGARRAPLREDRRRAAVLPGHPGLPAQRLFHQAVRRLLLPRQSAPPQRRLHRVRQDRHPSSDGRDLLSRRRRPGLRPRAEASRR